MTEKTLDARGLSCPQPVVLTQKAIKDGSRNFTVIGQRGFEGECSQMRREEQSEGRGHGKGRRIYDQGVGLAGQSYSHYQNTFAFGL
jgi:hypothetical protein